MVYDTLYSTQTDIIDKYQDLVRKIFYGFSHPEKTLPINSIENQLQKINLIDKAIGAIRVNSSGKIEDFNSVAINLYHLSFPHFSNTDVGEFFYINNKPVTPAMLDLIVNEQTKIPVFQLNNGLQIVQVKTIVIPFESKIGNREYVLIFFCNN